MSESPTNRREANDKNIIGFQGVIYPWQCDFMGHMNVKYYTEIFDQSIWVLFAAIGLTKDYFVENRSGMVALEASVKYFHELVAGDAVYVKSQIVDLLPKTMVVKHELFKFHDNRIMAECTVNGLHIDATRRKASPFPPWLIASFK